MYQDVLQRVQSALDNSGDAAALVTVSLAPATDPCTLADLCREIAHNVNQGSAYKGCVDPYSQSPTGNITFSGCQQLVFSVDSRQAIDSFGFGVRFHLCLCNEAACICLSSITL